MNRILASVLVDFELLIEERHAEIYSDPLPIVTGNELQLQQLFGNLISNALKFSNGDPVLKIFCNEITIDKAKTIIPHAYNKSYFEIRFEDNGIGFDQQYAEQIFVIFQRLNDKETSGTGIGLALCKKIVENHKGLIRVNSVPGKGTIFSVYLPAN